MARTVFANSRNFSHKGSGDKSLSSAPDMCKTPVGSATPPIPYPVVSQAQDLDGHTASVFIDGNETAIASSMHSKCSGDEAGTAKGIISGATGDVTEFLSYSFDVKCEGEGVVRHQDLTSMNKGNTLGSLLGATASADTFENETLEPILQKLILRLDLTPDAGGSCADTFTLSSEDGAYQQVKSIKDDMIQDDEYLDLEFDEIDTNKKYSLTQHVSEDGSEHCYFSNRSFWQLSSFSICARRIVER